MTFARASSLLLALGGSLWACVLLAWAYGFLRLSAGAGFFWLLSWLPGFFAWYAYLCHWFGKFVFRRARVTWAVSILGNAWSLFIVGSVWRWQVSLELPIVVLLALAWSIVALLLSIVSVIKEWHLREPERAPRTHVAPEEFKRLLDEHRNTNG